MRIIGNGGMGWIGRDNRLGAQGSDLVAPVSRGVGPVTNDLIRALPQPGQQRGCGLEFCGLAGEQGKVERASLGIANHACLGAKATARAP